MLVYTRRADLFAAGTTGNIRETDQTNCLSGYSEGAISIQQYIATVTHWVTNLTHTENQPTSIRSFSSAPVPQPAKHATSVGHCRCDILQICGAQCVKRPY